MKILLIDDADDIRKIAARCLTAVGKFQTLVAASAKEGLELARTERPDVILMDMMMPEMDGLTALSLLRDDSELRSIPVIFMTAKVQRSEVAHYIAMGAIGIVHKPFDPMGLSSEIRRILAERPAAD